MTDAATLPRPEPANALTARPAAARRRRRGRKAGVRRRIDGHLPALGLVLLATLLLRLWGIKQGLPYSYNVDEATHFVPRAVGFFGHNLNPHYFLNPPGYSILLYVVFELWFGSADAVARAYASDPTTVYVVARVVATVLGVLSVGLTYMAGRRLLDRTIGLLAAAVFGLAFLPIFYSHLALNDVPALAPVALSLYGIAGVLESGRWRDYAIAGVGIGLAAATKYTGGITAVCLVFAAVSVGARQGAAGWRVSLRLVVAGLVALVGFVVANPYAVLDFSAFWSGLTQQASAAGGADPVKLGSQAGGGIAYYIWTFTWGLGWAPALAALGGAGLLLWRRRWAMALVLIPAPIAFVLYMGDQQRFFGRWLLPVFPIAAILAAYGTVEFARAVGRGLHGRRVAPLLAGVAIAAVMLAQSIVTVVHDDAVLSRPDTRNLTRAWMVAHVPAGSKVVIEPVVPASWVTDIGRPLGWTPNGGRWYAYPTELTDVAQNGNLLAGGARRYVVVDQYERTLRPQLLDEYVQSGYCWLVVGSLQAGRAFANPGAAPSAIAYYNALAHQSRLVYHVSPFGRGDRSVPFSFDWSIDYYPSQYRLPGPEMSVYRLTGGRCSA
jgi:4-amino-4-deoxy-L-arabinose transferase-like glycosyltransferase